MLISIVIPSRDNIPYLSQTLDSLYPTLRGDNRSYEVIVVANGTDEEKKVTLGYIKGIADSRPVPTACITSEKACYAAAANRGIAEARGDFVVMLNDDVVVSSSWLDRMLEALGGMAVCVPEVKWGYAAPSTSYTSTHRASSGLPKELAYSPGGVEDMPRVLEATRPYVAEPISNAAFSCLLITRECLDTVGLLDEQTFENGFEDNDWCIRASRAGYLGVLAHHAWVYHYGSISLQKYVPDHKYGTRDILPFLRKWWQPRPQKVCVYYRVRIDTDEDEELFLRSLKRSRDLVDSAVVVDDRSSRDLKAMFAKHGLSDFVRGYHRNSEDDGLNEARDRNKGIELAKEQKPDWIMGLDHDQLLSRRLTRRDLQRLLNPANPHVKAYSAPVFHFYRGETHVRIDGIWGRQWAVILWRNEPCMGRADSPVTDSHKLHTPHCPLSLPADCIWYSTALAIEHYGFRSYRRCLDKRQWYLKHDTVRDVRMVGSQDYAHLTDESQVVSVPYTAERAVLLAMVNGDDEIYGACRLLWVWHTAVDDVVFLNTRPGSHVREVFEPFGVRVYDYACCDRAREPDHMLCDFAAARNAALGYIRDGDYVLFLDPDEEVNAEHTRELPRLLQLKYDGYAFHILNLHPGRKEPSVYETIAVRLFRKQPRIRYTGPVHETLEESFVRHPELCVAQTPIRVCHYGFLRCQGEARERRNRLYAEKLIKHLQEHPKDAKSLLALGIHFIDQRMFDDGDALLARAVAAQPDWFLPRFELASRLIQRSLEVLLTAPADRIPTDTLRQAAAQMVRDNLKWARNLNVDPRHPLLPSGYAARLAAAQKQ